MSLWRKYYPGVEDVRVTLPEVAEGIESALNQAKSDALPMSFRLCVDTHMDVLGVLRRTGNRELRRISLPRGWVNSLLIHDVESNDAQRQRRQDRAE
jgi:hypothetical protein